jgi:hypothetical protein
MVNYELLYNYLLNDILWLPSLLLHGSSSNSFISFRIREYFTRTTDKDGRNTKLSLRANKVRKRIEKRGLIPQIAAYC